MSTHPPSGARLSAPATARNRDPILAVLRRVLPSSGLVLEVASGTGEHAAYFAQGLPHLVWQPSDADPTALASIAAWRASLPVETGSLPPLALDAAAPDWPIRHADAVVCINMTHISPWSATEGLIRGAARILPPGGVLYLYGPYKVGGRHTAPSNESFDAMLKARDPSHGVRDVEAVEDLARGHGLHPQERVSMPANNLSVILRRSRDYPS